MLFINFHFLRIIQIQNLGVKNERKNRNRLHYTELLMERSKFVLFTFIVNVMIYYVIPLVSKKLCCFEQSMKPSSRYILPINSGFVMIRKGHRNYGFGWHTKSSKWTNNKLNGKHFHLRAEKDGFTKYIINKLDWFMKFMIYFLSHTEDNPILRKNITFIDIA